MNPKVNIQYGRLIDPVFIFYCQNNPQLKKRGWNDWTPPSKDVLNKRIKAYKEEWAKYDIIENISKTLNLSFKQNIIDVFIVSGVSRASSHPIIIKSGLKPREFVTTLSHELIHRILTENKIKKVLYDKESSDTTNNHVIIYSILKKILDKELWDTEVLLAKSDDYKRAIELSEKIGPDNAIKMMMAQ